MMEDDLVVAGSVDECMQIWSDVCQEFSDESKVYQTWASSLQMKSIDSLLAMQQNLYKMRQSYAADLSSTRQDGKVCPRRPHRRAK